MQQTMLAIFDNAQNRDTAVQTANDAGITVRWIGTITAARGNSNINDQRPFCLFSGAEMAPMHFLGHGATSCTNA